MAGKCWPSSVCQVPPALGTVEAPEVGRSRCIRDLAPSQAEPQGGSQAPDDKGLHRISRASQNFLCMSACWELWNTDREPQRGPQATEGTFASLLRLLEVRRYTDDQGSPKCSKQTKGQTHRGLRMGIKGASGGKRGWGGEKITRGSKANLGPWWAAQAQRHGPGVCKNPHRL